MTTPPPDPGHSGLRPLSPHGEGYCRVCCFVVGLTSAGTLVSHTRGATVIPSQPCKGSFKRPPKVTPYASRKSAFRVKSPDAWCPECRQVVQARYQAGVVVYASHSVSNESPYRMPLCGSSGHVLAAPHRRPTQG